MVTVDSSVLVTEFYTLIRINQYRYSSTHSFIQTGTLERFPRKFTQYFLCFIRVDCSIFGTRLIAESFLNFFLSALGHYSVLQV